MSRCLLPQPLAYRAEGADYITLEIRTLGNGASFISFYLYYQALVLEFTLETQNCRLNGQLHIVSWDSFSEL